MSGVLSSGDFFFRTFAFLLAGTDQMVYWGNQTSVPDLEINRRAKKWLIDECGYPACMLATNNCVDTLKLFHSVFFD